MTKKEVRDYITKESIKILSELRPPLEGMLKCSFKETQNSITLSVRDNTIILFIALDIDNVASFTSYVSRSEGKEKYIRLAEKKGNLYWYNGGHTKTDLKRYCTEKFSKEVKEMIDIFSGEALKEKRKKWI